MKNLTEKTERKFVVELTERELRIIAFLTGSESQVSFQQKLDMSSNTRGLTVRDYERSSDIFSSCLEVLGDEE